MSHAYIIQIAKQTAGIVARDHAGQAFRFFASSQTFHPLEGVLFNEPQQAEHAARGILDPVNIDDLTAFDPVARRAN
jgi:hypothetical protein